MELAELELKLKTELELEKQKREEFLKEKENLIFKIVLKNKGQLIPSILTQLPKKDSLQVWYKPIKTDSLSIEVTQNDYKKSFTFKVKDQKKDTLNIKIAQQGTLSAKNRFTLESATPLVKFDSTKMSLVDQDVKQVPFTTEYIDIS